MPDGELAIEVDKATRKKLLPPLRATAVEGPPQQELMRALLLIFVKH
jgi:hypothetical protein